MTETRIPVTTASPDRPPRPLGALEAIVCLAQLLQVLDSTPGGVPELQPEEASEDDLARGYPLTEPAIAARTSWR